MADLMQKIIEVRQEASEGVDMDYAVIVENHSEDTILEVFDVVWDREQKRVVFKAM